VRTGQLDQLRQLQQFGQVRGIHASMAAEGVRAG
jgi:hypothetical protein